MPPPCHSANTPGACGAAATNDSVNGTLRLLMDMLPRRFIEMHFTPAVRWFTPIRTHVASIRHRKTEKLFSRLRDDQVWAQRLQKHAHQEPGRKRGKDAVETEWRFMPGTRANHRGCAERAHPAVRVRRRPPAPGDRGKSARRGQPRNPA